MTIGRKLDGTDWGVGIQKPFAERNETIATLRAPDCSVVSSGCMNAILKQTASVFTYSGCVDETIPQTQTCGGHGSDRFLHAGDALSTVCMLLEL